MTSVEGLGGPQERKEGHGMKGEAPLFPRVRVGWEDSANRGVCPPFHVGVPCAIGSSKEPTCQCRRCKRCGVNSWVGKIPWGRKWQLTPVFLPEKFHGQRSLVGYGP